MFETLNRFSNTQLYIISYNLGCLFSGMHLLIVGLLFKAYRSDNLRQFIERQVSEKKVVDIETLDLATILTGVFLAIFGLLALVGTLARKKSMLIIYIATFGVAIVIGSVLTVNDWIAKSQYSLLSNLEVVTNLLSVVSVCYFMRTMDSDKKEVVNDIEKEPIKEPFYGV
jgi:hypothetical protein